MSFFQGEGLQSGDTPPPPVLPKAAPPGEGGCRTGGSSEEAAMLLLPPWHGRHTGAPPVFLTMPDFFLPR